MDITSRKHCMINKYLFILNLIILIIFSCKKENKIESSLLETYLESSFANAASIFDSCEYSKSIILLNSIEDSIKDCHSGTCLKYLSKIYNKRASAYRITGEYLKAYEEYHKSLAISKENV